MGISWTGLSASDVEGTFSCRDNEGYESEEAGDHGERWIFGEG